MPPDGQFYIFSHSKCQLLVADDDSYRSAVTLGAELPSFIIADSFTGEVDFATLPRIKKAEDIDWNDVKNDIPVEVTRETLAYVLYTSGSTGKPKGVMVKQLGVANIVDWFAEEINVSPHNSIVMDLTMFCFDISVLEVFLPLTRGGLLVLADSLIQKDPFCLLELMAAFKVSVFQATPTNYEMMLATGWKGDPFIDFLVGGEAFRPSLLPNHGQSWGSVQKSPQCLCTYGDHDLVAIVHGAAGSSHGVSFCICASTYRLGHHQTHFTVRGCREAEPAGGLEGSGVRGGRLAMDRQDRRR